MVESGQPHVTTWEIVPVPTNQEATWTAERVWTSERHDKNSLPVGIRTVDRPVRCLSDYTNPVPAPDDCVCIYIHTHTHTHIQTISKDF